MNQRLEETSEIYIFSTLLHIYVYFLENIFHYNPFLLVIYSSFLYSILYSIFGYSFTTFFYHPIWYKKTYQVAIPQLISSINNIMILKNDYNLFLSMVQTLGIYYTIEFNFRSVESPQSVNVRGLVSCLCFFLKYFFMILFQSS